MTAKTKETPKQESAGDKCMTERIDKTALSYWFPKLDAAGIPVPKTILLDMPIKAQEHCPKAGSERK